MDIDAPTPDINLEKYLDYVLDIGVPVRPEVSAAAGLARTWFNPKFVGIENLPDCPALFVGNHSFPALDAILFHLYLYYDYGRYIKALGDKSLFKNKRYAGLAHAVGAVSGHADVVRGLMARCTDLLLYPGGAHEAIKPPEARYQLRWKERYGFIRLALESSYTIVPIASVGPDEYYDQIFSSEQIAKSKPIRLLTELGLLPKGFRTDLIPPLPAGMLGSPLPKPKSTYFGICKPIDLKAYDTKTSDLRTLKIIRRRIEKAIKNEIQSLMMLREQQRFQDGFLRRILSA